MLKLAEIQRIVKAHISSEAIYAHAFDVYSEIASARFVAMNSVKQLVIQYKRNVPNVSIVWKLIIKESYTECRADLGCTESHAAQIWWLNVDKTERDTEDVPDEGTLKACLEKYILTGDALREKIRDSEAAYRKRTGADQSSAQEPKDPPMVDQSSAHEPKDPPMVKIETVPYNSDNGNMILFDPTIERAGCVALMNVSITSIEDSHLEYIFHMCVLIPDISITIATCKSLLCQDSAEILGVAMFYIRKHPALKDHVSIDDDQYNSSIRAIKQKMDINPSVECIFTVKAGKRVNLSTEFQILSLTVTYNR